MKNIFLLLILTLGLFGCSNNDFNNGNPYLPDYSFSTDINLDLVEFDALKFPSNSVAIHRQGLGVGGLILFNTGTSVVAYDLACPNHAFQDCSILEINGGPVARCSCDNLEYMLHLGISQGAQYPLKSYRVERNGNMIRVFN